MPGSVDLHIHSNKSTDGSFSPPDIVAMAYEKRMKAISIADHDTVAAYPEALQCEHADDVEVIPSAELTTRLEQREFHLLLPFIEWDSAIIKTLIQEVAKRRKREAKERVAKLRSSGLDISWEDVLREAGSFPPLGVTIAMALLKKAKARNDPLHLKYYEPKRAGFNPYRFYKDHFERGKIAYVPRRNLNILDVIQTARKAGCVPVLAHPGASFMKVDKKDGMLLKEAGLEGLEVYTSYHNEKQTEHYRKMAKDLDLVATAGSDFHGSIKPHIPFGYLNVGDYSMVEELKNRRQ